jgi:hypothetical protein
MRASRVALIVGALTIPSAVYPQDSGLVNGRVGSDLSTSPTGPSVGSSGGYSRPREPGRRAGFAGTVAPGQVVPQNVPIMPRPGGDGTAYVKGHRVIVGPNSDRILRVVR